MKERKHVILDHPIIGYFLLWLFGMIFVTLGGILDGQLAKVIDGYGTVQEINGVTSVSASGIGTAVGSIAAIVLFYLWFRPTFKGMLKPKAILSGLLMMLPCLLIHYIGSIVSITILGSGSVFIAFLRAFAPGFGEETAFRGLGVANYMRTVKSEKGVLVIFLISSIFFGGYHITNIFAGADPLTSALQSVYAIGMGMVFGAAYLRTGSLLPSIIAHLSVDFLEFVRADLNGTGGILTGMTIGDWITIVAGALGFVLGLYLVRPSKRGEIIKLWREKWCLE